MTDLDRIYGTIVWFRDDKGFGFIKPDDSEKEIFFHYSYLRMDGFKTIKAGARVSFELGENHVGTQATKISIEDNE